MRPLRRNTLYARIDRFKSSIGDESHRSRPLSRSPSSSQRRLPVLPGDLTPPALEVSGRRGSFSSASKKSGSCARSLMPYRLALDPLLAALPYLFLPDRHDLLEFVDERVASLERLLPVWRRYGYQQRCLPDLQPTCPVLYGDVRDRPAGHRLFRDLPHHPLRHLRVRVVLEVQHPPAVCLVAHHTAEQRDRPALVLPHVVDQPLRVEHRGRYLKQHSLPRSPAE